MRKIAILATSRATYGYKRRIIRLIHESDTLELQLIVTGMHLLKEYGHSVSEIEQDGFPIAAKVDMMIGGDTPTAWTKSLGVAIVSLAQVFDMLEPDLVLVTGDRAEMFAAASTAVYMNLPVAHIQAGDVSGHIDGSARHAITKLSHIHFPACEDSAQRVEKMGEEPWRIHLVGAPQLDEIIHSPKLSLEELHAAMGVDFSEPTILVIQHPVLAEVRDARAQTIETMEALKTVGLQTVVIYPNVDAGGEDMIQVIKQYEDLPTIHMFRNVDRQVFTSALSAASVLVGNSSCGILEAPSFKLPAVDIGNRQRGRMRACNVIEVGHNRDEIAEGIRKALHDPDYREALTTCVNPYGDGHSSERIVRTLEEVELGKSLLDKRMTY